MAVSVRVVQPVAASSGVSAKSDPTLLEALDSYFARRDGADAVALRSDSEAMKRWANRPLRSLSASDVAELIGELVSSSASLADIRREVAAVRGLMEWAREEGLLPPGSAGARDRPGISPGNNDRIIDAARTIFLAHGYRVSLATVAKAAGVTRQSIYNRFSSKERLFEAVLKSNVEQISSLKFQGGDLTQALLTFAHQYRRAILTPESIGFNAIGVAERKEFPHLARKLYERASGEAIRIVTSYLVSQSEAGRIAKVNYSMAAERFLGSVIGLSRVRAQSSMPADQKSWEEQYVRESVIAFVAGLSRHPASELKTRRSASIRERTADSKRAPRKNIRR